MSRHILALAALAITLTDATCDCGYKTNTGEIWQYAIETEVSQLNGSLPTEWIVSNLVREATVSLNYTLENVAINEGRLDLTCSSYNSSDDSGIRSGQIRTARRDILYGSFRASYSVISQSPGSVAGFFFYANDTQEIDIEIQSKMNNQTVHLGNQPTQSTDIYLPNDGAVTETHDYRFDWLKNETKFYIDSVPAGGFVEDTPVVNGTISLNMWGNGGTFTGPQTPTTDNVMSISRIMLYFNTSSKAESVKWDKACKAGKKVPACVVDTAELSLNKTSADQSAAKSSKSMGNSMFGTLRKVWPVGVGAALYHL